MRTPISACDRASCWYAVAHAACSSVPQLDEERPHRSRGLIVDLFAGSATGDRISAQHGQALAGLLRHRAEPDRCWEVNSAVTMRQAGP
jgi:hypothetical protein